MPLCAEAVGKSITPIGWRASARRGLAYAAAVAPADGRLFADDADDYALLPMAIVTPEWQAALALRAHDALGLGEHEHLRVVHAGQDTRFHAPMRPRQEVSTNTVITGLRAVPSGALLQIAFTTVDAQSGELVAETTSHSIYRGVDVIGEHESQTSARTPTHAIETPLATSYALPRGFAHLYSEVADIWNPIHTERRVALEAGLDDCIVHGTALWALAGVALVEAHASGDYARLTRLSCRFADVVRAGEAITIRHGAAGAVAHFTIRVGDKACVTQGVGEFAP